MTGPVTSVGIENYRIDPILLKTNVEQVKQERTIVDITHNETASYIPALFLRKEAQYFSDPVDEIFTPGITSISAPEKLVEDLKEDIRNHFETRFQLFFQQLLLSYNTGIVFEQFRTQLQVGLKKKTDSSILVEAHCSTLPSLSYITQEDKDAYFLNFEEPRELEPRIYAAQTSFQKHWNTTVKLPKFVNETDSKIDEIKKDFLGAGGFRGHCIEILNYNAVGKLNPQLGLRKFLMTLERLIREIHNTNETNIVKKHVLKNYHFVTSSYLKQSLDAAFFRKLTFTVNMTNPGEQSNLHGWYENIQSLLVTRLNCESNLWNDFARLKALSKGILPHSVQKRQAIIKSCILKMSLKSGLIDIIKQALDRCAQNKHPTATTQDHAHNYMERKEIKEACIAYLDSTEDLIIQNELDDFISKKLNVNAHLLPVKNLIAEHVGKRVHNMEWIVVRIMQHAFPSTQKAAVVQSSFVVQHFLQQNHAWADVYQKGRQFSDYMEKLMNNREFSTLTNELITKILRLTFA